MYDLTLIIPAKNEKESLPKVIAELNNKYKILLPHTISPFAFALLFSSSSSKKNKGKKEKQKVVVRIIIKKKYHEA